MALFHFVELLFVQMHYRVIQSISMEENLIPETPEIPGNLLDVLFYYMQDQFDRDMDIINLLEVVGYGSIN